MHVHAQNASTWMHKSHVFSYIHAISCIYLVKIYAGQNLHTYTHTHAHAQDHLLPVVAYARCPRDCPRGWCLNHHTHTHARAHKHTHTHTHTHTHKIMSHLSQPMRIAHVTGQNLAKGVLNTARLLHLPWGGAAFGPREPPWRAIPKQSLISV